MFHRVLVDEEDTEERKEEREREGGGFGTGKSWILDRAATQHLCGHVQWVGSERLSPLVKMFDIFTSLGFPS